MLGHEREEPVNVMHECRRGVVRAGYAEAGSHRELVVHEADRAWR